MTETIADRVKAAGYELPEPNRAAGNYVPVRRAGALLHVAGQIGLSPGSTASARLGAELDLEQGRAAAAAAGLSILAQVAAATGGQVSAVRGVQRLCVFIAATPEFTQHPEVANAASDLMVAVFGESGRHARSALGVASLPRGAAVEIEAVFEMAD